MPTPKPKPDENTLLKQMGGILAGAAIGVTLAIFFPTLTDRFGTVLLVLWSAVIGGALSNLGSFIRAGAALTRRENRWLNLIMGLGLPVLLLTLLWIGLRSLGR